jgi:hypothetical protein
VRSRDNAGQALTDIRDQLDSVVQYIDGSDAELIAGLAELDAVGQAVAPASRAIALNVLSYFSEQADTERLAIWSTLIRVASLTVALVLTLVVLSVVLFQLYRVAQTRSMVARETTSRLEAMVSSTLDAAVVNVEPAPNLGQFLFGWRWIKLGDQRSVQELRRLGF